MIITRFQRVWSRALLATEPPFSAARENITPTSVPPASSSAAPAGVKLSIPGRCSAAKSTEGYRTAALAPHRRRTSVIR